MLSSPVSAFCVQVLASKRSFILTKAHRFSHGCFTQLVSDFTLDKLLGQFKLAEKGGKEEPCSLRFTKSWGLPCCHYIRCCLETNTPILLQDIHDQWLLDRNPLVPPSVTEVVPPVDPISPKRAFMQKMTSTLKQSLDNMNPRAGSLIARLSQVLDTPDVQVNEPLVVIKKRGRPVGSKNKMTRDKSGFEHVIGRKCGICSQSRHNYRTCPQQYFDCVLLTFVPSNLRLTKKVWI